MRVSVRGEWEQGRQRSPGGSGAEPGEQGRQETWGGEEVVVVRRKG